jgi:RHS repeat-associated protein
VRFYHPDALGSVRAVTDIGGQIVSRSDYLPFGEQIPADRGRGDIAGYADDAGNKPKFTGKERDPENGLDYFGVRYFSAAQGRFASTDPKLAGTPFPEHVARPQSWNRYAYALGNPLRYVDPTGEDVEIVVSFEGDFSQKERQRILAVMRTYLSKKDVGKVVVREPSDEDRRTLLQRIQDLNPLGDTGYATIAANSISKGISKPHRVFAGGIANLRDRNPDSYVAKVGDGLLHEVLAHQFGLGDPSDVFTFGEWPAGTVADRDQQRNPYFRSRLNTLMDHLGERAGEFTQIRPLVQEDQVKLEQRLKPISRKYKDE